MLSTGRHQNVSLGCSSSSHSTTCQIVVGPEPDRKTFVNDDTMLSLLDLHIPLPSIHTHVRHEGWMPNAMGLRPEPTDARWELINRYSREYTNFKNTSSGIMYDFWAQLSRNFEILFRNSEMKLREDWKLPPNTRQLLATEEYSSGERDAFHYLSTRLKR